MGYAVFSGYSERVCAGCCTKALPINWSLFKSEQNQSYLNNIINIYWQVFAMGLYLFGNIMKGKKDNES